MRQAIDEESALRTIDEWFRQCCDGEWEHRYGIRIETTDNPGWLLTIADLEMTNAALSEIVGDLLRLYGAQVATDYSMVRVYCESFQGCVKATAALLDFGKGYEERQQKPEESRE